MAKQIIDKHFEIRHQRQGIRIQISTDWTKPRALQDLLFYVALEVYLKQPDKLQDMITYMQIVQRKLQEGKKKIEPVDDEDHTESFEWWRELMETPPPGVGGGHN